jgi:WD40 repeat protein
LIESTPLQIYASVLAFSPTNSLVRKSYNEYYPDHPGWIIHKQSSTNWGGIVQTIICQRSYEVFTIAIAKCGHLAIFVDGFVSGEPLSISIYNVHFGNLLQKVSIPSGDLHFDLSWDGENMYSLSPDGSHLGFLLDSGDICTWNLTTESMKIVPSIIQDSELGDISTGSEGLEKSRIRWMDIIDAGGFWLAVGFSDTQGHLVDLIDGEYIIELEAAHASSVTLATCQANMQGDYVVVAILNDRNLQSHSGHSILVETWSRPNQRVFVEQIPLNHFGESSMRYNYMAISPDGTRLALSTVTYSTAPSDSRTVFYDLGDPDRLTYCKTSGGGRISWSPDGAILAVHQGRDGPDVAFYESTSGDLRAVSNNHSHMGYFSPDGMYYVFGADFETVIEDCTSIFSSKPEHGLGQQKVVDQIELITISSDGKLAGVSYEYGRKYVLYNTATASEMSTTKPGRAGAALDQNKGTLERDGLSLQYNSTGLRHFDERTYFDLEAPVKVYGKEEAARISKQRGQGWALQAVSFSLETQLIKFVDGSKPARADFLLYHREVGCVELELGAPPDNIFPNWWTEWTFSPDGNLLAAHAIYNAHYPDDTLVGLWCTKTGRNFCLENVPDIQNEAWVSFSQDGQTLFTNGANLTIERKRSARQETISLTTKKQLGLSDYWVIWEGERILWLPPEYRENAMIGRTKPGVYVIGLVYENTGNVSFLHFYPEKMLFS